MDASNNNVHDASTEIESGNRVGEGMLENRGEGDVDVELEELRRVRRALGKMNQGIENVQHQMKYFNSNVSQTTQLLDIWVRILSQTAHNQAFLSSGEWQGGKMDSAKLGDLVQRDLQRQEEAERKIRDAEQKRDQERAEAKERERKRAELAAATAAAANDASARQPPTRPGLARGRRPPPPSLPRDGSVAGTRSSTATATRGGRGRGRGTSIPPATGSRIRPPR
ncbi:hypothetical protein GGI19_001421 [Coemansia pectinata]|uniref:DASH complex subunit DUO1 n=1 Tax=Coemansia pectinata TaxID=1052879 RepID=A0A9W8H234_9FUNG|nr:hypothetical protein GGI19_001421 [Coemansia pectinata]